VPALVMLVGLPMYQAVGTSLVIIAANSLAGFIGHLEASLFDTTLIMIFVATGLAGTYAGSRLAQRLPAQRLKQVFAVFVLVWRSIFWQTTSQSYRNFVNKEKVALQVLPW
jgi:uncharacterized protein